MWIIVKYILCITSVRGTSLSFLLLLGRILIILEHSLLLLYELKDVSVYIDMKDFLSLISLIL